MRIIGYKKENKFLKFFKHLSEEREKRHILYEATRERTVECPNCHAIIAYKAHETENNLHHHTLNCPSYWCDVLIDPCPLCHKYNIPVTFPRKINDGRPLCWYSNVAKENYPEEYYKILDAQENK